MDLFNLFVKVGVKDEASDKVDTLSSKIKGGLSTAAKIGTAAVTTAATAVTALVKKSVENYAEYEQLVGGVETLFKNSADQVEQYANKAYQTAGLSANAYMETVTSFSASLLQSLGGDTEKAAEYADQAVIDMADNANKMGTSIESIQWAYQGFAKQNYTMLDNLKLGYGGTKEEMERLVADAAKLDDSIDANSLSFGNVTKAIHAVQTELGITGTTSKEASETIQGSVSAMKASWENVLTAMADDNQDFGSVLDTFVESAGTALDNILPRVEIALGGASNLIDELIPVIIERVPTLISENLPKLTNSAVSIVTTLIQGITNNSEQLVSTAFEVINTLVNGIISAVPMLISAIPTIFLALVNGLTENLPLLIQSGIDMLNSLATGIVEDLPTFINTALDAINGFADMLTENLPLLLEAGIQVIMALVEGLVTALPDLIEKVPEIVSKFANLINDNAPTILKAGIEIIITLIKGLIQAIPTLVENIPQIIQAILDVWEAFNWASLGKKAINLLKDGMKSMITGIKNVSKSVVNGATDFIKNLPSKMLEFGKGAVSNLGGAIRNGLSSIKGAASNIFTAIINALKGLPKKVLSIGTDLVKGIWNGISNMSGWIINKIKGFGDSVLDGLKDFFGIHSPSRLMRDEIGKNLALGIGEGFTEEIDTVNKSLASSVKSIAPNINENIGINGNSGNSGVTVNQYIYAQKQSAADLMKQALYQQKRAVTMGV